MDAVKSHDDLALAIRMNSSIIAHAPRPNRLVLPTEEWQPDSMQLSVVTGDEGRLGNSYMCLHVCLQGTTKTLLTKLKAYLGLLQMVLQRFTNYYTQYIYSVDVYLRYSRRRFPWDI